MITQKMAASKDIAATWGGGRAEGAGRPDGPVRNGPDRSGPPLPCRGLDPCSSPVFCRQVESLQAACRHQARCRTHVTPKADKGSWISRVACPRSCPRLKAAHQISEGPALEYGLELASCMYAFFFCTSSLPFTVTRGYVGRSPHSNLRKSKVISQ